MTRLTLLGLLVFSAFAQACTAFLLKSPPHIIVGKSFDWSDDRGYLTVNPRGLEKKAFHIFPWTSNLARWASQYGSLTFNQHGSEMPIGGINEAGLIVESLWLDDAVYPKTRKLPDFSCHDQKKGLNLNSTGENWEVITPTKDQEISSAALSSLGVPFAGVLGYLLKHYLSSFSCPPSRLK